MKKGEDPKQRKESLYEVDTYVNIIALDEPKQPATGMGMDYRTEGLDFSPEEVNVTYPYTQVLSNLKKQRVPKSVTIIVGVLMVIIMLILVVLTAITFQQYPMLEKHTMEEMNNLKTMVANISDLIDPELQKHYVEEMNSLKMKMANLSDFIENMCSKCPVGWHTIGSSCYYISGEQRTWTRARDECYKVNSFLVIIKDKTESDSLRRVLNSNWEYWIGLRRDSTNIHIWKWIDGSEMTFTNWGLNQPNDYKSREHCVEIRQESWHDLSCDDNVYYICEKERFC